MSHHLDVFVVVNGSEDDIWRVMPADIHKALADAGYRVRSVTTQDNSTGLTGTYRDDRTARQLAGEAGN